jgi:TP901 family phage tail tape measure protein
MAEITQKLGFDAGDAIRNLSSLTDAILKANSAMTSMKSASKGAAALAAAEKQIVKTKNSAKDFTISWQTLVRVLETQLIVRSLNLVTQALQDSVEQARLLGLAIEEIRTIDEKGRGAASLSADILALSDAIGKTPVDVAEGVYQTLSNQVVEAGEAFNFTSTAAKLAVVTVAETGEAVDALSSIMNSYGLEASETERIAGTLFRTVDLGRLRLGELADIIGRVTPITAQLGITWEETAASIATMTQQGVRADTAITQLRAVITRLIKPTDDVTAIFHKWGVVDGKQAIETFGGLRGVLAKLQDETGNSSEEMAELLRNVRAITGAFGIMVDGGKTVESVLREIEGSSNAANVAWEQFAQSDAQRLTQSTQEFSNQITRLGQIGLPAVAGSLEAVNYFLEVQADGWSTLLGLYSEAEKSARLFSMTIEAGNDRASQLQKTLDDVQKGAYDNLRKASNLYYTEANRKEQQLAQVRANSVRQATAVLEDAADSLTDFYKDSLKGVEQFADKASDRVKQAFEKIADVQRDVQDQTLEYRLDNEEDGLRRLTILDEEFAKAREARNRAISNIGADPSSLDEAEAANARLVDLGKQRVAQAKELGYEGRQLARYQDDVVKSVSAGVPILKSFADIQKSAEVSARQQAKVLEDNFARTEAIGKRIKEIFKDGLIDPKEKVELEALRIEQERLNATSKEGMETLKAFGLDINFNKVVDGLTLALNKAQKDWDAEVKRAEAAFQRALIPIKVKLELSEGGLRKQIADEFNLEQFEGETLDSFARRIDSFAADTLDGVRTGFNDIAIAESKVAAPLAVINRSLKEMQALTAQNLSQALREQQAENSFTVVRSLEERQRLEAQIIEAAKADIAVNTLLDQKFREANTLLQQRGSLQEGTIAALRTQYDEAFKAGEITKSQLNLYTTMADEIAAVAEKLRANNELRAQMPEQTQVLLLEQLSAKQNELAAQKKVEAQVTAEMSGDYARINSMADDLSGATQTIGDNSANTAASTGTAATNMGQVSLSSGTAATNLSSGAMSAAAMAANLERAAAAAAAVQAAGGRGALTVTNPYVGGNYADGGLVRGKDRTLVSAANDEMIVNAKSSRRFFSELNAMNQGNRPVFREQGGPVTNVGDVNVTVNGGDSSQQTVREFGHALRRQIQRGNIKLR